MAYSDFTLEEVITRFNLLEERAKLFDPILPLAASEWLQETLSISLDFALASGSEKARSEFIIAPILLELERQNQQSFAIYSGKNLDVDKINGLVGECDFILSKGKLAKTIQAPIFALVEAKKQDIDSGLGQCTAQLLGAQLFNQKRQNLIDVIFGCVTTGETWQFLRLQEQSLLIDRDIFYINELEKILGVLQAVLDFYN
jgi:hypothetical protein